MAESAWGPASPDTVKRWGAEFRERRIPVKKKAVVVVKKGPKSGESKPPRTQRPRY
jgi:hypothetical protein